ncbi:DDE_Tnp_1_7 domain-containing protein [Nephila pilipes]|uniref:DDE_Tnp_1_7 domain-containing protein n=1 Tax=Nephila pilipes TaxID=299642 RepID=A0A8X6MRA7_NEPPI|nr:DDE_Tnp_1_7 domain-containing protein [Nephila pilipes]
MCDVGTKYMVNAISYLDSHTQAKGIPLTSYFIEDFTRSIHGTNRNITMDNWFASIPLSEKKFMQPMYLTIVGALRKNKKVILPELLQLRS